MCHQCDYEELLSEANLGATPNRVRVLEVVGDNRFPLSADDIHKILQRSRAINRVTVYRILDLLVEHGVVERISTGGRAFYYDLAPNDHHKPHPHFYCKNCGQMDCLSPESLVVDTEPLWKTFPGRIEKVEVRIDGICKNCENAKKMKSMIRSKNQSPPSNNQLYINPSDSEKGVCYHEKAFVSESYLVGMDPCIRNHVCDIFIKYSGWRTASA